MERFGALEPKTSERWRVGLALLVALLALPLLLLDYQSGADAADDAVTLSADQSGELVPPTSAPVPETTTSTAVSTTVPFDATQVTEALPTTAPPATLATTTTSTPAPASTEPPASTQPPTTTPPDTEPPATTPPDSAPPGTTPPDSAPPETTTPPDTVPPDTVPPDTVPPDTVPPETVPPATEPPSTTVAPAAAGLVTPVPAEAGDPTAEQWSLLRQCESSNNYSAVNSSGKFRGAYQFSQATWDWVAGTFHPELVGEDPAAALPGNQDAMALATTRMQSPGNAWPHCSRVAGIA